MEQNEDNDIRFSKFEQMNAFLSYAQVQEGSASKSEDNLLHLTG